MSHTIRPSSHEIRPERPEDVDAIARVTEAAFAQAAHASGTERFIVDALRREGGLVVSLVACDASGVVGHVAVSPVAVSGGADGWYGLGPISVQPACQGRGVGSALMREALAELRRRGARGCVLLGDPAFYRRFGFVQATGLTLPGVPPEYFLVLAFDGEAPLGKVRYHRAFEATG